MSKRNNPNQNGFEFHPPILKSINKMRFIFEYVMLHFIEHFLSSFANQNS